MKILVSGDWHLGAGASLGREPGDRLNDQRAVTQKIAALAAEHDVEAVLLAGDLLDGPQATPEELDVLADFVDLCHAPIVAVLGNGQHDLSMRSVNGLAIFDRLPGIDVYSRPALHDLGEIAVACLPWSAPSNLVARMGADVPRDQVNARAAKLLVTIADGLKPHNSTKPTVLLMHGSISGASLPQGIATDDLREPVVDVDALLSLEYAAIVAGHIHAPQLAWAANPWLPLDANIAPPFPEPFAIYTGSPLPLNFGETNVAHGCWILDVTAFDTTVQFVPIESRPLVQFQLNEGLQIPDIEGAIVKAKLTVTESERRHIDVAGVRARLLELGAHTVKVEVETIREDRARVDTVTDELSPLEAFDAWADENAGESLPGLVVDAREQMQADLEAVA